MRTHERPRVAVFSLGGTIAMTPQAGGGVAPALSADELLSAVPGLAELGIGLDVHDFRRVPGATLDIPDVLALAAAIEQVVSAGVDGVVVTQGTDTIEESAYLLDLLHPAETPIVVTGAMRSALAPGADGPANLLTALRVAASPLARGLGCLVALADEIHAARHVRKAHATSIAAFTSYPGPLGYVVEDCVRIPLRPSRGPVVPRRELSRPARTSIVTAALGDDGAVLGILGDHVDGLVVAAFGAGHVPADWVPPLTELAAGMPVVLTSRTGAGPVLSRTYAFGGSESDLLARGLVSAGQLSPSKARILLHVLLMAGADSSTVSHTFNSAGAG
ncbi:L-asparaginase [Longimycelium tulufanense]|uniref:L-asparaginase n=1 Tax=Longimycelium tulufanense TaxID=907463 RepID=A0A8J3FXB4_9PSEU|nr:asparaginase [Longimycelium tulufanense]GGM72999.1 L-asparaginase [Longimycelium tulufanense]